MGRFLLFAAILAWPTLGLCSGYGRAYELLRDGFSKTNHSAELREILPTLDPVDRTTLYEQLKKNVLPGYLANQLVGLGIGSYVQGDRTGGAAGLLMDLLSMGATITGGILMVSSGAQATGRDYTSGGGSSYEYGYLGRGIGVMMPIGTATLLSGILVYCVSKIYQALRPLYYTQRYNDALSQMLLSEGRVQLKF
ncbi:MAG: P13 family porin [Spirochaetes bacterium]|nr:P13 family porin [Spirochaetota bacterium]